MRRMLRILFWLGLGLSTILFAGTGVLWVRSIGHRESWGFSGFEPRLQWKTRPLAEYGMVRSWSLDAIHGRLWLQSLTWGPAPAPTAGPQYRRETISADQANYALNLVFEPGERRWVNGVTRAWRFSGVYFRRLRDAVAPETGQPRVEGFDLAIPFWLLAVIFGLWPVCLIARRLLRRRRYGAGLCPSCGYDLRATPDRCPECGRVQSGP